MISLDEFYLKDVILENDFIKLIPFSEDYADGLREIIFDNKITKYTGNHINTETDLKNYIRRTLESRKNKIRYPFVVIHRESNQLAGSTSFGNIIFPSKRLEIGWTWYGKSFRGTGINYATKYELLKFAFEELDFNRVQFSVDIENVHSQKAVLKLGATQEGIFRSNYVNAFGEARDDVYFSIIRSEWPHLKTSIFNRFM